MYRLCSFDSNGRLIGVSPERYGDESLSQIDNTIFIQPNAFAYIDENYIPSEIAKINENADSNFGNLPTFNINGMDVYPQTPISSDVYDPRIEIILAMQDPSRTIGRGTKIVQDYTKTNTVCNDLALEAMPIHSSAQSKFGPSSGKFTRSILGLSGGYITVSNLSKDTVGGYTALHNNISAGLTWSFAVEMFFYPTSASNNFTLIQKGPTGQYANWKIGYDSSAGFLQFAWQTYGTSAGYNRSQNIVSTAGMTLNQWHHVAVSMVRNATVSVGYLLSGYFNGINVFSQGVTLLETPEVRYDNPLYIGNNPQGTESYEGYIDSLRMIHSGVTTGIFGSTGYGFLPYGSGSLGVPTLQGFDRDSSVAFTMNFNGPDGSNVFFAESTEYIAGSVIAKSEFGLGPSGPLSVGYVDIGVFDVVRYSKNSVGPTAYSDATGFSLNYGPVTNSFTRLRVPYQSAGYYLHGYDYSYNIDKISETPNGTTQQLNHVANAIKFENSLESQFVIEGVCGNRGSSGNVFNSALGTNPFRRLFSAAAGNCYGVSLQHNSLSIDPNSSTYYFIINEGLLASQGVSQSSYEFIDARNIKRTVTSNELVNMRLDILEYQSKLRSHQQEAINNIKTSATVNDAKIFAKRKKTKSLTDSPVAFDETDGFKT